VSRLRQDLIDEILQAQFTVFRVSSAASAPAWIDLDLTMSQMKGLRALAFSGPATVSQLAEVLRISQPTASQLVDRLVQAGLADREEDSADRRRTIVRLNRRGQQLHERLRGQLRDRFRHWLQRMNTGDLEALHRGYQALARIASIGHADGAGKTRPAGVPGKESEPFAEPGADSRIK
jgi:DNA-binding MarR family transcriptional regulator